VTAVLTRLPPDQQAKLRLNRWDLPGVEVFIPPNSGLVETDGASRIINAYVDVEATTAAVVFGAAGWFDEQGPRPPEPWTRWWCHTSRDLEAKWNIPLQHDGPGLGPTYLRTRSLWRRLRQHLGRQPPAASVPKYDDLTDGVEIKVAETF